MSSSIGADGVSGQAVTTERRGHVLVITLHRPEVRNAIDGALAAGLDAALQHLDDDAELRAGVLTGAGGNFCAGMDLAAFAAFGAPKGIMGVLKRGCATPLVAAVEGVALGGGLELALLADMIVASRRARLGIPEVRIGLVAAGGGLLRLPDRLPRGAAARMALTGDPLTADEARQLGLVDEVVEEGSALAAAVALAQRMARNAPLALVATKQLLAAARDLPTADYWEAQRPIADRVFASDDARAAAEAWARGREPRRDLHPPPPVPTGHRSLKEPS